MMQTFSRQFITDFLSLSCVTAGRSVALDRRLRSNSGDVEEERSVSEREEQQVYFYNLVFLLLLLL